MTVSPEPPSDRNSPGTDTLFEKVYDELRRLAAAKLSNEKPGQTLQPTALVNDVYMKLKTVSDSQQWNSQGHFFAAAAEAMRRILVDKAREKMAQKRGGDWDRIAFETAQISNVDHADEILSVDELFDRLAESHPDEAALAKLHYFGGYNVSEAAKTLGIPTSSAHRYWAFARAWLIREIGTSQNS